MKTNRSSVKTGESHRFFQHLDGGSEQLILIHHQLAQGQMKIESVSQGRQRMEGLPGADGESSGLLGHIQQRRS